MKQEIKHVSTANKCIEKKPSHLQSIELRNKRIALNDAFGLFNTAQELDFVVSSGDKYANEQMSVFSFLLWAKNPSATREYSSIELSNDSLVDSLCELIQDTSQYKLSSIEVYHLSGVTLFKCIKEPMGVLVMQSFREEWR